jgi:hypothetical protein
MNKKLTRNPWLIYAPFLFYYFYYIIKNKWPSLYGDEIRYMDFAKNLVHGFYSPNAPHINLWNGPGYPIVLMPFVALHIPALYITLMNGLYLYLAVVLLYISLTKIANHKIALICGLLLAVYPNAASILPILYTEAFTYLLVSLLIYMITFYYLKNRKIYLITVGLILGYLLLTKIIFGYVIIICIAVCFILSLVKKNKHYVIQTLKILFIAFGVAVPYLAYTYYMTGKVFYWGNSGGMSLYWMSTPYDNEYGDWKVPELTNKQYPTLYKSTEATAILKKNHANEIKYILAHKNEVEQDALFKQIALQNIWKHPMKFVRNYYYNVSRMLFNFPYSYAYQDAAIVRNIISGSLILWGCVFGTVLTLLNWRSILFPVKFVLLITAVYLLLSGALSAYPRQLDVILPALLFWWGYLAAKTGKVQWSLSV